MHCTLDLFTQTDGLSSPKSYSTNPLFFSSCITAVLLPTSLRLNPSFLSHNVSHSPFPKPCLRVTGLSGQADASLSVQSEADPGPRPAVPKVYLSVCLSSPAVALASHLSVKSPSVMGQFKVGALNAKPNHEDKLCGTSYIMFVCYLSGLDCK